MALTEHSPDRVFAIFNTVLGEELLFRGLLLPRMRGVFGKRDWVANGLLSIVHSTQSVVILAVVLAAVLG